jgi:uncharacterized protein YecT (DUF1311 family)
MINEILSDSTKVRKSNSVFAPIMWMACLVLFNASANGADPSPSPTPDPIDQKVQDLIDKSNGSTSAMVEAAREGYQLWDQELNRVYSELMRKLPSEDQAILRESQQAWIKFRDNDQKLSGEVYGRAQGTVNRVLAADERLNLVKDRAVVLRNYLEVVENDWAGKE